MKYLAIIERRMVIHHSSFLCQTPPRVSDTKKESNQKQKRCPNYIGATLLLLQKFFTVRNDVPSNPAVKW